MDIKVINNVPNINVTVNKSEDGSFAILVAEDKKNALGSYKPGSIVKIGNREYIVLGHSAETTAVITKDFATSMRFGINGNWTESDVREYCNGEFYDELVAAVGANHIIKHNVNLVADDGTGNGKRCRDNVSILTNELYRRYREFLNPCSDWWWTSTRTTCVSEHYIRDVCCVSSHGVLNFLECSFSKGVRPFCILDSSILI